MRLKEYCLANCIGYSKDVWEEIFKQTRDAAYQIIERKGATYYAVANGLLRITEAILRDQDTVLSLSTFIEDYDGIMDVYLSLPSIVGRNGIKKILNLTLSAEEISGLSNSARILKELIKQFDI
jgi:L-lactate dehydrogenase